MFTVTPGSQGTVGNTPTLAQNEQGAVAVQKGPGAPGRSGQEAGMGWGQAGRKAVAGAGSVSWAGSRRTAAPDNGSVGSTRRHSNSPEGRWDLDQDTSHGGGWRIRCGKREWRSRPSPEWAEHGGPELGVSGLFQKHGV